jgi:Nif-specific regulatory protein
VSPRVLVVDDDDGVRYTLAGVFEDAGLAVTEARDGAEALALLQRPGEAFDLVVSDLRMPRLDGMALLERARAAGVRAPFVMVTAHGSERAAVEAMKRGAYDYFRKPFEPDELLAVAHRALDAARLRVDNERLAGELALARAMVFRSAAMSRLAVLVQRVASRDVTVLLTGESGTGKERVAQAIHESSSRRDGPFVKLHCAALAETLLESELFGHEKGAFTGAAARREGRFKLAHGGTLFLDEISEVSPAIQVKLLRVLQEREFERVGGNETLKVDVRIIAATNRDLAQLVREGKFREDLYYRLNVVALRLPPLRERREDIPLLADFFLQRFARDAGKKLRGFTPDALAVLTAYPWPGNVRELENAVERAVVLAREGMVDREHFSLPPVASAPVSRPPESVAPAAPSSSQGPMPSVPGSTLADLERYAILSSLDACGGSTHKAAAMLDVSVRMIQYRLREYRHGIKRTPAPRDEGAAEKH